MCARPRPRGPTDSLTRARTLAGQLGAAWVDPWALGDQILAAADRHGGDLEAAALDVVSLALRQRALAGHAGAWTHLVSLWEPEVSWLARRLAGQGQDPVAVARRVVAVLARGPTAGLPGPGLRVAVMWALLQVLRQQEQWARVRWLLAWSLRTDPLPRLHLADAALLVREADARMWVALEALPVRQRLVLWARDLDGQDLDVISAWSGLGESALHRRLRWARWLHGRVCRRLGVRPPLSR